MLVDQHFLQPLYRCPASGEVLEPQTEQSLSCSACENCSYDIVDGYPILVDFDNSILTRGNVRNLSSVIERREYAGIGGFLKRLVAPPQTQTSANVSQLLAMLSTGIARPRVLVAGGGAVGQGMHAVYDNPDVDVVSFDIYASAAVQFVADAHRIPLADESFDAVIIQAVLEHVLEPDVVVAELHRVLRPAGVVYAETPFMQQVHEGAYDFTRYTESGHRYLFRRFELIGSGSVGGVGTQLMWSLDYFARSLFRSRVAGKAIKALFFWLQYADRIIPESYNVDAASAVYFMGHKAETGIEPRTMVGHYQGAQQ